MEVGALHASVRERFAALASRLQIEDGDTDALWNLLEGCAPLVGADSLGPPEVSRARLVARSAVGHQLPRDKTPASTRNARRPPFDFGPS